MKKHNVLKCNTFTSFIICHGFKNKHNMSNIGVEMSWKFKMQAQYFTHGMVQMMHKKSYLLAQCGTFGHEIIIEIVKNSVN